MSNGNITSQPSTPVTNSPQEVPPATQEAKRKIEKRVQELAGVVLGQQSPPGTPKVPRP
ncbi:MAG TPA: hypothetical protein VF789_08930 [Thermoanaerobaculia bacterium]